MRENEMINYYTIQIIVKDVDDYVLTNEECKKISYSLIDRINKDFGFVPDDDNMGSVLSVSIKGGCFDEQ